MRLIALTFALLAAACASPGGEPGPVASMPAPAPPPPPPGGDLAVTANTGTPQLNQAGNQQVANPTEGGFRAYLGELRPRMLAAGIAPATWDSAMSGVSLNMKSISLSSGASGGMGRIWTYLERVDVLLPRGRAALSANRAALDKAARETGVDAVAIAGIWGNETSYGNVLGNFYVVEALASLAYEGRRRAFFEEELLAALTLLQEGLVTREELTGSYAGALGQVQFMPSNILKLGRDGDGDGERDLRGSLHDAFLSCGNYLRHHGWRPGEPWLAEARLPAGFRWELAGPDIRMTAAEWDDLGVRAFDGRRLTAMVAAEAPVSLILPAGHRGVPLIAFENYRRFLDYNPSQAYAIAVAHLANRLAGAPGFAQGWPADQGGMSAAEMTELQSLLVARGYDLTADGRFGDKTRRAVRAYQLSAGLPADGYPTGALLNRLRNERLT